MSLKTFLRLGAWYQANAKLIRDDMEITSIVDNADPFNPVVAVEVATVSYKVYTALLTQTGTDAPVANVLENTLEGTVVWTRDSVGLYIGTLAGVFVADKVFILCGNGYSTNTLFGSGYNDANSVYIETHDETGSANDGLLQTASIEIRVYP